MSKRIPVIPDNHVTVGGEPYDPVEWEQRIDAMAAEAHELRRANLRPGGKSLTAEGVHSPVLQVRVPEQLHDEVKLRAKAEGISMSKLMRRALEKYLRAT